MDFDTFTLRGVNVKLRNISLPILSQRTVIRAIIILFYSKGFSDSKKGQYSRKNNMNRRVYIIFQIKLNMWIIKLDSLARFAGPSLC